LDVSVTEQRLHGKLAELDAVRESGEALRDQLSACEAELTQLRQRQQNHALEQAGLDTRWLQLCGELGGDGIEAAGLEQRQQSGAAQLLELEQRLAAIDGAKQVLLQVHAERQRGETRCAELTQQLALL